MESAANKADNLLINIIDKVSINNCYDTSMNGISKGSLLKYNVAQHIIIQQINHHLISLHSINNEKDYVDINLLNQQIIDYTDYNQYLVILTNTNNSIQKLIILNISNIMKKSEKHNETDTNTIAISENDIIEINEILPFNESLTSYNSHQQIQNLFKSMENCSSSPTEDTNEEPSRKKRKLSQTRNVSSPICKTKISKMSSHSFEIAIGDINYFCNDINESSIICCINLNKTYYNKLIYIPSISKSIKILLTFTNNNMDDNECEIGMDLFKVSFNQNKLNRKRKYEEEIELKYDLYSIWKQSVIVINNKINNVAIIKQKYKTYMNINGIDGDYKFFKSLIDIKCSSTLFVSCDINNNEYLNTSITTKV